MNKKILIIDDDLCILEAIKLTLELEGYSVEVLISGEKAVQKIKTFFPDLILLDVLLSGEDGRNIAKKLKSDDKTKNIPIVMMSAQKSTKNTSLESGASDFISKPFEIEDLISIIEKNLNY